MLLLPSQTWLPVPFPLMGSEVGACACVCAHVCTLLRKALLRKSAWAVGIPGLEAFSPRPQGSLWPMSLGGCSLPAYQSTLAITPTERCYLETPCSVTISHVHDPNIVSLDLRADLLWFMGAFWSGLQAEFMNSANSSLAECALPPSKDPPSLPFLQFSFYVHIAFGVSIFFCLLQPSTVNSASLPMCPSLSCAFGPLWCWILEHLDHSLSLGPHPVVKTASQMSKWHMLARYLGQLKLKSPRGQWRKNGLNAFWVVPS